MSFKTVDIQWCYIIEIPHTWNNKQSEREILEEINPWVWNHWDWAVLLPLENLVSLYPKGNWQCLMNNGWTDPEGMGIVSTHYLKRLK